MIWNPFRTRQAAAPPEPSPPPEATPPVTNRRNIHRRSLGNAFINAGETDRFTMGWGTQPQTADWVIEKHYRTLVARSRQQAASNDYARKYLKMCINNIVGPKGVALQAQVKTRKGALDAATNEAIEQAFAEWGRRKHCDIRGRLTWRGIQSACVNSAGKDGEFFVRMIWGADAGPWGFALQTIDPLRCPIEMKRFGLPGGHFIRQGIEFNPFGRAVAYYFSAVDSATDNYQYNGQDYIRIPANEIIHGFVEDMEGQRRGLPWMATSLYRLRQLTGMEDAALINARIGASKMGFVSFEDGKGPDIEDPEDFYVEASPGEIQVLPEGGSFENWDPQYPDGEFAVFTKKMLQGISSGLGVSYPALASDLEGVNFSSIRQGTLDEREHWKGLQEWFIESLLEPVFEAWLIRALLAGKIRVKGRPLPAEHLNRFLAVQWQPRRWSWVDPRADAEAANKSKNNHLTSPSRIIREAGGDPDAIWRETASDVSRMIEAYVAQGIDKETATKLVLQSMGMDKQLLAGKDDGEKNDPGADETKTD